MQKMLFIAFVAVSLSACSSGKGGSSSTLATSSPAHPVVVAPSPNAGKVSGHIMSEGDNHHMTAINTSTPSSDTNIVMVNGKPIAFIPPNTKVDNINIQAQNIARIGSGDSLKHSRYGYMHEGANSASHLFAQGIATPIARVPNQGVATYTGDAVHRKSTRGLSTAEIQPTSATLNVNFGNKTFNGHIGPKQALVAELSGTIKGNVLSGTSTSAKGVTTSAQFYGPNAEEIAGVYRNASGSNSGAFGVKK